MGTKRSGKKEEAPRQARDTTLQPKTHCEAQPERGENQVVTGTSFSWEKQRDLESIPAGVGSTSCI